MNDRSDIKSRINFPGISIKEKQNLEDSLDDIENKVASISSKQYMEKSLRMLWD